MVTAFVDWDPIGNKLTLSARLNGLSWYYQLFLVTVLSVLTHLYFIYNVIVCIFLLLFNCIFLVDDAK
jgi:hypothetical protein